MTTGRTDRAADGRGGAAARLLRDRNAGLCLAGVVVSGFGTSALWLASGVWVKDLTGSDGLAALCMLALWAPVLAGPLLGTLADRFRRKPLLIAASLLMAGLLLTLLRVDSPHGCGCCTRCCSCTARRASSTTRPSRRWSPRPSTGPCSVTSTACAPPPARA